MKDYIVKTNYGYTYKITAEQVAEDYASIVVQFDDEVRGYEVLKELIMQDEEQLDEWYGDQIQGDLNFIHAVGEIISIDMVKEAHFMRFAIHNFGQEEYV